MLVIRAQQTAVFEEVMLARFDCSLVKHLQEFAPLDSQLLGVKGLKRVVRLGRESAAQLGITDRDDIRLYVELMFLFGSGFATDPQYPWAAAALSSHEKVHDPRRPAVRLHASALEYTRAVLGDRRAYVYEALRRLAQQRLEDFIRVGPFPDSVIQQLRVVFPPKCTYLGDAKLRVLVQLATDMGQKHGIATESAVALFTILIFLLGHQVDVDPTAPWVEATLRETALQEPLKRIEHLERETWGNLVAVLSAHQAGRVHGMG